MKSGQGKNQGIAAINVVVFYLLKSGFSTYKCRHNMLFACPPFCPLEVVVVLEITSDSPIIPFASHGDAESVNLLSVIRSSSDLVVGEYDCTQRTQVMHSSVSQEALALEPRFLLYLVSSDLCCFRSIDSTVCISFSQQILRELPKSSVATLSLKAEFLCK